MRRITVTTKLKSFLQFILLFILSITYSSCSDHQKQKSKSNMNNLDTSNENLKETKKKNSADSSVIAILSTDGKLIREYKYLIDNIKESYSNREPAYNNYIKGYPEGDTIIGDFNGDGKLEKAWFNNNGITALINCEKKGDKKSCKGIILFSNTSLRQLKIDYCPMRIFKNEGDLNGDGKDEIGVLPGWFSSACRSYCVYTYQNNRWIECCEPIANSYNMREAGIVIIEKDKNRKGYAIGRESVDNYISSHTDNKIPFEYIKGSCCLWSNVVEHSIKLK